MIFNVTELSDFLIIKDNLKKYNIDYMTTNNLINDYLNNDLYALKDKNKIVAICSIVYDSDFNRYYIKRALSFEEKKGHMRKLLTKVSKIRTPISITPFKENVSMINIIELLGFRYEYTFLRNFQLYTKM